jgi:hypothetical protein
VHRAVHDSLDIRFIRTGRRPEFPSGCTAVVLMTRFIGHLWHHAAFARFPRSEVHLCPGGSSQLVRLLGRLASADQPGA